MNSDIKDEIKSKSPTDFEEHTFELILKLGYAQSMATPSRYATSPW